MKITLRIDPLYKSAAIVFAFSLVILFVGTIIGSCNRKERVLEELDAVEISRITGDISDTKLYQFPQIYKEDLTEIRGKLDGMEQRIYTLERKCDEEY